MTGVSRRRSDGGTGECHQGRD